MLIYILFSLILSSLLQCLSSKLLPNSPNIIFILADDLGYGDLGFEPFNDVLSPMRYVKAPNLNKLATNGLIMTNFHAASPVCSPSRVSVLTGLFPWRLGVDFIYSQDLKLDGSEELNHEQLPLLPNIVNTLRDNGYYTAHVGKWHLGGITPYNMNNRLNGNCTVPGLHQYGYDEFVVMSEGHKEGARYFTQLKTETYHQGSKFLYKNDKFMDNKNDEILTDRQTLEALRIIKEQYKKSTFFINLWYDAPHSPWECIEPFCKEYSSIMPDNIHINYASMISNMDYNIGKIMILLDELNISNNTLIIFTSDNGPENDVGSAGKYKGKKRSVLEGGIKVPAMLYWPGTIKSNSVSDNYALTTDIFPTLLDIANITFPAHIRIDGISIADIIKNNTSSNNIGDERTILWYSKCPDYPKFASIQSIGFKLIWTNFEGRKGNLLPPPFRLYDLRNDKYEYYDLFPSFLQSCNKSINISHKFWNSLNNMDNNERSSKSFENSLYYLIHYLHIRLHLFRYLGDADWLYYHNNKPYEISPTCHIRDHNDITLNFNTYPNLAPEFCGASIYNIKGYLNPSCKCALGGSNNNCNKYWINNNNHKSNNNGWLQGSILNDIELLYGKYMGTLIKSYKKILSSSQYTDFCNNKFITNNDNSENNNAFICNNTSWTCGDLLYEKGSNKYLRNSFQDRFIYGSDNRYVQITPSCAYDAPLFTLYMKGMPVTLPLCPESFSKLSIDDHSFKIDDNMMLVSLYCLLYASSLKEDISNITISYDERSLYRYTYIIDPLVINNYLEYKIPINNKKYHFLDTLHKRNNNNLTNLWNIDNILIPILISNEWSLIMINNIKSKDVFVIYYSPNSKKVLKMNDLNDIVSSILFSIYNDKSYSVNVKSITGQGNINGSGNTGLHLLSFLKHAFEVIISINKNIKMASGDKAMSVKSKLISTFGNTYSINSNNMNELRLFLINKYNKIQHKELNKKLNYVETISKYKIK